MIEYRIDVKAKLEFIKPLWKTFFKTDQKWHFTLEGDYVEIRVPKKIKAFDAWLKRKKLSYTTFEYLDNIPITRKYQKQFEKIFHGLSELSMVVPREKNKVDKRKEVDQVLERCIHLAFNILGYDSNEEMRNMAGLLVDRCYFYGHYFALQEQKEKKK